VSEISVHIPQGLSPRQIAELLSAALMESEDQLIAELDIETMAEQFEKLRKRQDRNKSKRNELIKESGAIRAELKQVHRTLHDAVRALVAEGVKDSKIIESARISKATLDSIKYGEVTEEIDEASDNAEVATPPQPSDEEIAVIS
jgi:ABC-type phosphate transport system auxiliary subunit